MEQRMLLTFNSGNFVIDWVLPVAGVICIILCITYFSRKLHDSDKMMQEFRVEKLGIALKLSSIPFMLLLLSIVLIIPTLYFHYNDYKNLAKQIDRLEKIVDEKEATIISGKNLIKEIQNCTLPIYITLKNVTDDTYPTLDAMKCELHSGTRQMGVTIAKGIDRNQYKILLDQVNCNTTIEKLEIIDEASNRHWVAKNITPCEYVVRNLNMDQIN